MIQGRKKTVQLFDQVDKAVAYWMTREQRVEANFGLAAAMEHALEAQVSLYVVFNLLPSYSVANFNQYAFMLEGLVEVADTLSQLKIPFKLLFGDAQNNILQFIKQHHITSIYADMSPLRNAKRMQESIRKQANCSMHVVDSHNIVPVWIASDKKEFAAHTIRKKIHTYLPSYAELPQKLAWNQELNIHQYAESRDQILKLQAKLRLPKLDQQYVIKPGYTQAVKTLEVFIQQSLEHYASARNDPNAAVLSAMSAYLHFGQISSLQILKQLESNQNLDRQSDSYQAYVEELVVRKELADNFCYYEENYDSCLAFHPWAQKTLEEHRHDTREYVYSYEEFDTAKTHDPLWNAAQTEMKKTGKMHGYLRMYWAKKILEWTNSPEEALKYAIDLNDRYQLDGRDPNGYTGIAWSIGGIHDRAWNERPVYGKIRYMNYNGAKRKFDVERYIRSVIVNNLFK